MNNQINKEKTVLDFFYVDRKISRSTGVIELLPNFKAIASEDLMIKSHRFYAIWDEELGLWNTSEQRAIDLIDNDMRKYAKEHERELGSNYKILYLWDTVNGQINNWHRYVHEQAVESFKILNDHLVFANDPVKKKDYATKRLNYPLLEGDHSSWDKLVSTLYDPEERMKIEWCIGAIISGDSRYIQKFAVFYGSAGTGKSTILNIIESLFGGFEDGYVATFDAKALGSTSRQFAMESFRSFPLVAIQHDGDLSRIEDNTRLNSLVSHEKMLVEAKYESAVPASFNCFLFMGTNRPVKITDSKSGILRRLIDITPSGRKLPFDEYTQIKESIEFEKGAIAEYCKRVYLANKRYYDNYTPLGMMSASNDFYNFMVDSYVKFSQADGVAAMDAWVMYKAYCDDANVHHPLTYRIFREELKNYFKTYTDGRKTLADGTRVWKYYEGFREDKFLKNDIKPLPVAEPKMPNWLTFENIESVFDTDCSDFKAQYGDHMIPWDKVTTRLRDLKTDRLHYVLFPPEQQNHIVVDFDKKGPDGQKSLELNIEAASTWPKTYAELSKSGQGIHLHYIYTGDPNELGALYSEDIEIKVFVGHSSLRRKLTKCNGLPIATISSGLPKKEAKPVIDTEFMYTERKIRTILLKAMNKEYHPDTTSNVHFIKKTLEEAYESGVVYDVSDMFEDVYIFAMRATNNSKECMRIVRDLPFKSKDSAAIIEPDGVEIIFYDVEVFVNLFIIVWKRRGADKPCVHMINPSPDEVFNFIHLGGPGSKIKHKYGLVGFNNRDYDNHILYARSLGYTNAQLYELSQRIINGDRDAKFRDAYNLSYTDVYDFSSVKQSLKKFEIELGIHHHELGLPWNEPVPEDQFEVVADYCEDDVIATEAVFNARENDWRARCMLSEISGATKNDKTSTHSANFMFGEDKHPQSQFNWRNMGDVSAVDPVVTKQKIAEIGYDVDKDFTCFDNLGRPVFPGYVYDKFKRESRYRDIIPGEGGFVFASPGMWINTIVDDIASMHPSTIDKEDLFGKVFTARFNEIKKLRLLVKHHKYNEARLMFDGRFTKYLNDEETASSLAKALKLIINQVYGLTAASFENRFRDPNNIDNIVAKRGALFMINLKYEVERKGFTVAHIKTDSIKIPNATPEIIDFVYKYGQAYGYTFEHESTYSKMCLVNRTVYIAKYASSEWCENTYGYIPEKNQMESGKWTATGAQFAVPYVFKTMFSHDALTFSDYCEAKSVRDSSIYLDLNEELKDVSDVDIKLKKLRNKMNREMSKGLVTDISQYEPDLTQLKEASAVGHNLHFVGRVGNFCPVKPGCGGGVMLRDGKNPITGEVSYSSVNGSKGYRWLESEFIEGKDDYIDHRYFQGLVNEARDSIAKYGDVEWFLNDDGEMPIQPGLTPPWEDPELPWSESYDEASEIFARR